MFTCEQCGRQFTAGAIAVVGLPHPTVCPSCRRGEVHRTRRLSAQAHQLLIACIWTTVALIWLAIMLYGEWKRTEPFEWTEPPHVDPTPGDDGAPPEDLPRISSPTAHAMSLDF